MSEEDAAAAAGRADIHPGGVSWGVVLVVGGFQFSGRLRRARPQLHRWLGRTYLTAVLVGGMGGLGWTFDEAYITVAWFSWVPNLVIAEWWILQRTARTSAA